MQQVITAQGLIHHYGTHTAVAGIDFQVAAGECFGFLGPNGAGKSTTMRMLCGLSPVHGGSLHVLGYDVKHAMRAAKARLGVVPQEDNLDINLRVFENLLLFARFFGLSTSEATRRAEELLELMELKEKRRASVRALSGGMRRRLLIARALIHQPELLILDEPTTGLDPQARHLIWERLLGLKQQGVSLVLTTHYMEEAAQLCDRLVIMDHGKILTEGKPAELIQREVGAEVLELLAHQHNIESLRADIVASGARLEVSGAKLYVIFPQAGQAKQLLPKIEHRFFVHRPASLEDVFVKLTGRDLRDN